MNRNVIGVGLIAIIILLIIVTYLNKDTFFQQTVETTYPDGCMEVFINGNLTTEECVEGRKLYEEEKELHNEEWRDLIKT